MKRLISIVLCVVFLGSTILPANAIEMRSSAKPVLSFSGTEALNSNVFKCILYFTDTTVGFLR